MWEQTAGTFTLMTEGLKINTSNSVAFNQENGLNFPVEIGEFDFSTSPSGCNYTALAANNFRFSPSSNYVCKVVGPAYSTYSFYENANSHLLGQYKTVPGSNLFMTVPGKKQVYQPVVKTLYAKSSNIKVLDDFEADELSIAGGSVWTTMVWDSNLDIIILPTANLVHVPYEIQYTHWKQMFTSLQTDFSSNHSTVLSKQEYSNLANASYIDVYSNTLNNALFQQLDGLKTSKASDYAIFKSKLDIDFGVKYPLYGAINRYEANYMTKIDTTTYAFNPESSNLLLRNEMIQHWARFDYCRDNLHFGPRFDRALTGSLVGIKACNGRMEFAARTHGLDLTSHDTDFFPNPVAAFLPGGFNEDAMHWSLARYNNKRVWDDATDTIVDSSLNITGDYLIGYTKSRMFIFDYQRLCTAGKQMTGTHGPYHEYELGITHNTCFDYAVVWAQSDQKIRVAGLFDGWAFDGDMFILQPFLYGVTNDIVTPSKCLGPDGSAKGLINSPVEFGVQKTSNPVQMPLYAYNIPNLIRKYNAGSNLAALSDSEVLTWARIFPSAGWWERSGTQFYGNLLVSTCMESGTNMINPKDGTIVQTVYWAEGQAVAPVIVDGIMYNYGGTNKEGNAGDNGQPKDVNYLVMWTPYGK
jgi:hypothetical protein